MDSDNTQIHTASVRTLRQRIMRRIYLLFMVRNLSPLAFDVLGLVVLAFVVRLFVSIRHVWQNLAMASGSGNLSNFSLTALSHTELETKLLFVVLGVVGFFAVRHLRQAWRAVRTLRNNKTPNTNNQRESR